MSNNGNELNVRTIQSAQPPMLGCQAIVHTPLPDGRTRHSVTTIPTADLNKFRDLLLEEKQQGRAGELYLTVHTIADEKGEPDFGLSELLDTQRPSRDRQEGETMLEYSQRWHEEVREATQSYGPDALRLQFGGFFKSIDSNSGEVMNVEGFGDRTRCTLFVAGDSVLAQVNRLCFVIPGVAQTQRQAILARNEIYGIAIPPELEAWARKHTATAPASACKTDDLPPSAKADHLFIYTSQEIDILERSACDGSRNRLWRTDKQQKARIWERRGGTHVVKIPAQRENDEELTLKALEALTLAQDADFTFALLYVISALAPPSPLPENRFAGGWIDLDEAMEGIGWHPSKMKSADRDEARRRMWNYLEYGDRAVVTGKRTITYTGAQGEEIPTRIESAIWRIMDTQKPVQGALFDEVPRRAQIVINKQWEPLLTEAKLVQYLPLGELLSNIPPNQITGSWARVMGLVLARLWRMSPRETMHTTTTENADGKPKTVWIPQIQLTRRELLTAYTPKTKTVEDVLKSKDPGRAVKYWHDALRLLVEREFLADAGEAKRSLAQMLASFKGQYGWGDAWLDGTAKLAPGPKMQGPVQKQADALPALKPKDLQAPKRRPGRPKKQG